MVAPSYSATRSALAKSSGLGRKPAAQSAKVAKRKAKA
jgi:predicted transcriptional regulator